MKDGPIGRNAARLLAIGDGIPLDEPWRECFQCGHLLFGFSFRRRVLELLIPVAFCILTPSPGCPFRRHRCLAPLSVLGMVREDDSDVDPPVSPTILSNDYAHRRSLLRRWRALLDKPL